MAGGVAREHVVVADGAVPEQPERQAHPVVAADGAPRRVGILVGPLPCVGQRALTDQDVVSDEGHTPVGAQQFIHLVVREAARGRVLDHDQR